MTANLWQLNNFGRVDVKPDEFDKLIYQKGAKVIWQKSSFCSCVDEQTGQADFTCPACFGKGYTFFDPLQIRAIVSSMTGDREQMPIGLLDIGSALITTRAVDMVGFRDRMTFTDFLTPHSQPMTFKNDPLGELLRYECEQMVAVRQLSNTILPTSYTITADKKRIQFKDGTFAVGDKYALLYRIQPVYIVIDIPHELRGTHVKFGQPIETFVQLPKQFMIKREDLLPLQRGSLS